MQRVYFGTYIITARAVFEHSLKEENIRFFLVAKNNLRLYHSIIVNGKWRYIIHI